MQRISIKEKKRNIENKSPQTAPRFPPKGKEFARGAVSFFFSWFSSQRFLISNCEGRGVGYIDVKKST
ncbi:hypothetical protein BofuT4_P086510.1 [Botrytis cinerea T4]|uniref:Uncharacterized protein n=1 Tax=Botryotinia fuckeliana (strain T4) TaxID=999810 RepID=G2YGH4_BOTF4|nr:hypothetical protein BofuT4_P086510.1 [Botrytis cinerea T4]